MIPHLPPGTVIPSVRRLPDLDLACETSSEYVLLAEAHIGNLAPLVRRCKEAGKRVMVHADLLGGFRPDVDGVGLLRNLYQVVGVFSSNTQCLDLARRVGLITVQRLLLVDSRSLDRGRKILASTQADAVEVLNAAAALHCKDILFPLAGDKTMIAGGFIDDPDLANKLLESGYHALTSSHSALWETKPSSH